mgnify:CR=1 FL=1
MRRSILLMFIALILASLSCQTLMPSPTPVLQATKTLPPTKETQPTQEPLPSATTAATPVAQATKVVETQDAPATAAELPPAVVRSMNQIQRDVMEIRGLQASDDVPRALLSSDELRQRVIDDFLADYTPEDAQLDVIELSAFGLVEPGFDFLTFFTELLSEQVAGFYDDEFKEMYVVAGEDFGGMERLTFAHEYVHALVDQTYDIQNGLDFTDESCEADTERCAAIQALMEGDATNVELEWFINYATQADQQELIAEASSYSSPVFDSAPPFMQEDFLFPYVKGQTFVPSLLDQGGWEAVDAAYQNLPVSTEQILHPKLYPNDRPLLVELPDLSAALGEGWQELDRNVLGEWYTYLTLARGWRVETQLDDETALAAAAGWGGDAYVVYHNDTSGATVLVVDWLWDREAEADEFAGAFATYASARFGVNSQRTGKWSTWETPSAVSLLYTHDNRTIWVYAPNAETAQAIVDTLEVDE